MWKIVSSNWISLVLVFGVTFVYTSIQVMIQNSYSFPQATVAAVFSVVLYGMFFWFYFVVSLILWDAIIIYLGQKIYKFRIIHLLVIEWMLVALPFIYGGIRYHRTVFIIGMFAFALAQILRNKKLKAF